MKAFSRPKTYKQHNGAEDEPSQDGMELRDYYAAKAMQGLLANTNLISKDDMRDISEKTKGGKFIVGCANEIADAMIKARD